MARSTYFEPKTKSTRLPDQVSAPAWSADGTAVYFRAVDNNSYDETIYRYTVADQKLVVGDAAVGPQDLGLRAQQTVAKCDADVQRPAADVVDREAPLVVSDLPGGGFDRGQVVGHHGGHGPKHGATV